MKTRHLTLALLTVTAAFVVLLSAHADPKPTLRAAGRTDFPPFEFIGENHQYRGFNVDLAKLLVVEMGANVKFQKLKGEEAEKALSNGEIDFILGKLKTPEDENKFDFCDRAVQLDTVILVRMDQSIITCLRDLKGRTVLIDRDFATPKLIDDLKESTLLHVEDQFMALELLDSGKADALIAQEMKTLTFQEDYDKK